MPRPSILFGRWPAFAVALVLTNAQPPAPNRIKTNPMDGLVYVWILPGTFMMGCSPNDSACEKPEQPAHKVTITKGFWIGQTETTQAAYRKVVGKTPRASEGADLSLPADLVEWRNARDYCAAVGMRLPTEAEWEYAARGGIAAARYGDLEAIAWYSANDEGKLHAVAKKQPNNYGLFDMVGNAAEWVSDWYDAAYYSSSPENDPQGPQLDDEMQAIMNGRSRTVRGRGSFRRETRVSARWAVLPTMSLGNLGFRCAGN